jgi:MFS family permease
MAIGVIPYLVLEYPLGYIADKWLGEKEFLMTGFSILSISLIGMWFLHDASFWWWVGVMVLSRIGAAMVESMTEVHFFRHVTERDASIITAFRALRPLGSVVGPLIASLALIYLSLPVTFVVFGVVMLLGIPLAYSLVDTK